MTFDEAVQYLLSLGHETLAVKLGLRNVERLLAALGSPHEAFPAVQIAGTNGKGSTAAMLDSVCRAANLRAGLYTSPHLVCVTERVRVAGRRITREEFARQAAAVRAAALPLREELGALPTFFEQVTAVALCAFREARVGLAILETGLGGRLDATTAARAATVAVTPVALDHQEYLGRTLREIAAEKAAIIRPGVRAVVAAQGEREALEVILARCRACGVEPRRADFVARDATVTGATPDGRLVVTFRTGEDVYEDVRLALRGRHQLANAAAAVALAEDLRGQGFRGITRAAVVEGLETAEHAGRLELVAGRPALLFDGAHNAAGARALRAYLDEFARQQPVTLLFGAMRDKELAEIASAIFPVAARLVLTRVDSPRAAAPDTLSEFVPQGFDRSRVRLADSAADALRVAHDVTPPGGMICVTGSLYLIGEIRRLLTVGTL